MADTPFPIPRELRQTDVLVGNGGKIYGPFEYLIFDVEDVRVFAKPIDRDVFEEQSVIVTKVYGNPLDYFYVAFDANIPVTTQFIVVGERLAERSAGMAASEILAVGNTAANSSDVAVTDGGAVTVGIKGNGNSAVELSINIKDDLGVLHPVGMLTSALPVCLQAPGVYVLSRAAGSVNFGAYRA